MGGDEALRGRACRGGVVRARFPEETPRLGKWTLPCGEGLAGRRSGSVPAAQASPRLLCPSLCLLVAAHGLPSSPFPHSHPQGRCSGPQHPRAAAGLAVCIGFGESVPASEVPAGGAGRGAERPSLSTPDGSARCHHFSHRDRFGEQGTPSVKEKSYTPFLSLQEARGQPGRKSELRRTDLGLSENNVVSFQCLFNSDP